MSAAAAVSPARWLERIRALPLTGPVKILNVCGGHERSITLAGLRSALPAAIELIPGPGCPVCVCPESDLRDAIALALSGDVTVAAFGDMLRVPVNGPRRAVRSLEEARAAGADVHPIAAPQQALALAARRPGRRVVFFAAGFETTMAPVAALIAQGVPDNLFILLSGRRTWPAVALLLAGSEVNFQCLIAPGHVCTVMGPDEWEPVAMRHHIPVAVAGFTPASLLAAVYAVLQQRLAARPRLANCYPGVVRPGGNPAAQRLLSEVMQVVDAEWRGVGLIPASGFALRGPWRRHDARALLPAERRAPAGADAMPPGCDCARVVMGRIYPNECVLYGRACTPERPVGPCMVSDEGACHIWWAGGIRPAAAAPDAAHPPP